MNNLHLQMNNKPQAIGQKQAIPGKHANNIQKVKLFNFTNCQRNTNEDQHQTICKQTKRNSGKSEQQNKRKGSVLFSNLLEQNQMFSYSLTSCKKQHRDQHEGIVSSVLPCHAGILNHSARSQLQVLCFQSNFLPMHVERQSKMAQVLECLPLLKRPQQSSWLFQLWPQIYWLQTGKPICRRPSSVSMCSSATTPSITVFQTNKANQKYNTKFQINFP